MVGRKSVTRRRRRARDQRDARENYAKDEDVAARGLWKELEDERRRGLVQALNVQDGALVVYYVKDPVPGLPRTWRSYPVRQEKYAKPESELVQRGRGALLGILSIAEKEPERLFKLVEGAVETSRTAVQFVQQNPDEVRKFLLNNVVAGVAKGVKKRLERG